MFRPAAAGTVVLVIALIVLGRRIVRVRIRGPYSAGCSWRHRWRRLAGSTSHPLKGLSQMAPRGCRSRSSPPTSSASRSFRRRIDCVRAQDPPGGVAARHHVLHFVLSIHIPRVAANHADRFAWGVVTRDFTFGLGAWMLAASSPGDSEADGRA